MAPAPARKPATYQDLLRLPENVVGEILDDELVVSPRPAPAHAWSSSVAGSDLVGPFHRRPGGPGGPGGWWVIFEPELHLGRQVLVPDLAGWRRERMPVRPATAWIELAPDWACEVLSPRSARRDRLQKMRIFGEEGVRWIWLVDPIARTVEAYERQGEHWLLLGNWGGDDPEARIPPFDAVAIDLGRWWEGGPPEEDAAGGG